MGKFVFLTTNAQKEYADQVLKYTLGENWLDYFDLVIANARKPLF
jgi:hypothetical protein